MSDKAENHTIDTRVAAQAFASAISNLETTLTNASLERKVEIGSLLWALGDDIKKILNGIKDEVRHEAIAKLEGQTGAAKIEGDDIGEAVVTVPQTSLRVPKGVNMEDVKSVLGSEYSLFFDEVVTFKPRKEFQDRVVKLTNPLHQQILHNSVERVEPTPRVSFRRHPLPKRDI